MVGRVWSKRNLLGRSFRGSPVMIMVFVASLVALLLALDDVRGTMVTEEVVPAEEGKGSDVVVITRENFASTLKEGKWFVKFYTPWCSHCNRLQPTWEELATDLKGKVNVGQVDCDVETSLCKRFHVKGYPTLVHVDNRKARQYQESKVTNARSKAALYKFAVNGYHQAKAFNALKSPFGPVEIVKAVVVDSSVKAQHRFLEQLERGTSMGVLCLGVIALLVVGTSVISLLLLLVTGKPKHE